MAGDSHAVLTPRIESEAEMLARAEAAIQELARDYPVWAIEDVLLLEQYIAAIEPGAAREDPTVTTAFKKAHDMRGQGGSFGYPSVTYIANSLCQFMNRLSIVDAKALAIFAAHAKALRAILSNRLSGDGNPAGEKLVNGLDAAVRRHLENEAANS